MPTGTDAAATSTLAGAAPAAGPRAAGAGMARRLHSHARALRQSRLARSAAGSFGLNVASNALAFVTAIILARVLGAADYGIYSLALVWANILGFVAALGFPQLIVRETARLPDRVDASSQADGAAHAGAQATADLLATSWRLSLAAAIALAAGAALAAPFILPDAGAGAHLAFVAGLPMVVLTALQRQREAVLLGVHRPVTSLVPERVVRPVLMLAAIGALALAGALAGNAQVAVLAQVTASVLTLVVAIGLARRAAPVALTSLRGRFSSAALRQALPFLFVGLTTLLATRLDVVMLGMLADAADVGHYRLAAQIAAVALLVATASQAILSPEISRHAATGALSALRGQIVRYAVAAALVTVAGAVAMVVVFQLAQPMIGASFAAAHVPLVILLAGYTVMALLFPALPLLTMTGNARLVGWANVVALVFNAGLNLFLIPRFGGTGAALATLASLVLLYGMHVWNVVRLGLLRQTGAAR